MNTSERLAAALDAIGLVNLARRARVREFSDFASPHSLPKLFLMTELADAKTRYGKDKDRVRQIDELRHAVKFGEYDDTKEEGDAWFNSQGVRVWRGDPD